MFRKLTQYLAVLVGLYPIASPAMDFKYVSSGGNIAGSEWISAEGVITNSTAKEFEDFLLKEKITEYAFNVALDSPGGSLYGGVELGKKIRQYNMSTSIGKSVIYSESGEFKIYEQIPGKCMSACAFAFLGGVTRTAEPGDLGIHQFYQDYAISNPDQKLFDSRDLQSQQAITGLLLTYASSMGVDPSFISKSSVTPPADMYFLTRHDLISMKIIVDENKFQPWTVKANNTRFYLESKTPDGKLEAYVFCGSDRHVRLAVYNPRLIPFFGSFENVKSAVSEAGGIGVFWTNLPKRAIRAVISNGIAGVEVVLPDNFSQIIRPTNEFGGMTAASYVVHALWGVFQYDLSYENFQNGITAITRSCQN